MAGKSSRTSASWFLAISSHGLPLRILIRTRPGPVRYETHLSAEKAQASEDARLPRADAHAGWTIDAEAPPGQGSQAPHGVMSRSAGARSRSGRGRLSRSADFDRVFRSGR